MDVPDPFPHTSMVDATEVEGDPATGLVVMRSVTSAGSALVILSWRSDAAEAVGQALIAMAQRARGEI